LLEAGGTIFAITGLPIHGELITPDDATDLKTSGYVRADAAGSVRAVPHEGADTTIDCTLSAGEFFPCMVKRVHATGTSATPLHLFY
jgi:hypothetical protein